MSKSLKIGFFTWKVVFQPLDGSDHGYTLKDEKAIYIDSKGSSQEQRETLFHELCHACFADSPVFKLDYPSAEDREEDAIRHLSPAMMQVICDNKWLQKFLFGGKR